MNGQGQTIQPNMSGGGFAGARDDYRRKLEEERRGSEKSKRGAREGFMGGDSSSRARKVQEVEDKISELKAKKNKYLVQSTMAFTVALGLAAFKDIIDFAFGVIPFISQMITTGVAFLILVVLWFDGSRYFVKGKVVKNVASKVLPEVIGMIIEFIPAIDFLPIMFISTAVTCAVSRVLVIASYREKLKKLKEELKKAKKGRFSGAFKR